MICDCPKCGKAYDHDGFYEHRVKTVYYCTCEAIFDADHKLYAKEEIDWTDLRGPGCSRPPDVGGLFIKASRIKSQITSANYEENLIELERLINLEPKPGTVEAAQKNALKRFFSYLSNTSANVASRYIRPKHKD